MDYKICCCVDDEYIYACGQECERCYHYETKKSEEKLKKTLDKQRNVCYNIRRKDKERRKKWQFTI